MDRSNNQEILERVKSHKYKIIALHQYLRHRELCQELQTTVYGGSEPHIKECPHKTPRVSQTLD